MGGGLALSNRRKWPIVYDQYYKYCRSFDDSRSLLSHVQTIAIDGNLIVANCFGQHMPGHGLMTDYNAWDKILPKLADEAAFFNNSTIHFPWMIGCGLAGGDWNIMQEKIEKFFLTRTSVPICFHKFSV